MSRKVTITRDVYIWFESGLFRLMRKQVGRATANFQVLMDTWDLDKAQILLIDIFVGIPKISVLE